MFKIFDQQEPTYDEAKKFIGGYIQSVPLENDDRLLCDEEGKLKGLAPNPEAQSKINALEILDEKEDNKYFIVERVVNV